MKENLLFYLVVLIHTVLFFMFTQELEIDIFKFVLCYFFFVVLAIFMTPVTIIETFILDRLLIIFLVFINVFIKKQKVF